MSLSIRSLALSLLLCFSLLSTSVLAQEASCPDACSNDHEAVILQCAPLEDCELRACDLSANELVSEIKCQAKPTPPPPMPPSSAHVWGDPHVVSFDDLEFDCQVKGEFVLTKSDAQPSFELQGRFSKLRDLFPTFATAFVSVHEGAPKIQMTIPQGVIPPGIVTTTISGCPVVFHMDGQNLPFPASGAVIRGVLFTIMGPIAKVRYTSGIEVAMEVPGQGCVINRLTYTIPGSRIAIGGINGLFGIPNGNRGDDWNTPDGTNIPIDRPTENQYCSVNWCITQVDKSLFTYFEDGASFTTNTDCLFNPPTPILNPTEPLRRLCGNDANCLLDGQTGGIELAQLALETTRDIDAEKARNSNFISTPRSVLAGTNSIVKITLDVSAFPPGVLEGLEKFVMTEIDPETNLPKGNTYELFDNGFTDRGDAEAGDFIFSNLIAIDTKPVGETMSFRAVPVINELEDITSVLTTTGLNIIRSFSKESGLGEGGESSASVTVDSIDGVELKVALTWAGQTDLDTSVEFLGHRVGYSCDAADTIGQSQVIMFGGDTIGAAGTETTLVFLDNSRKLGLWTDATQANVILRAGWHSSRPANDVPVVLVVVLQDSQTKEELIGTTMTLAVTPGVQDNCAEKMVASLDVKIDDKVTITLNRSN